MNPLKRIYTDSIIKVIEIDTELFDEVFNESNCTVIQVAELTNIPRRIAVEYEYTVGVRETMKAKEEIETLNL